MAVALFVLLIGLLAVVGTFALAIWLGTLLGDE